MASWTAPVTYATGDILAVTSWNGLANNSTFLYQAPYGLYYNTTAITAQTSNNYIRVPTTATTNSGYGYSVSSGSVVVPLTGMYLATGNVTVTGNSTSTYSQGAAIYQGSTIRAAYRASLASGTPTASASGSTVISCTAADTLNLFYLYNGTTAAAPLTGATQTYLYSFFIGSA
jgi:hypothetical protein